MGIERFTNEEVEKQFATFKKYLKGYITRPGIEEFLTWIDRPDVDFKVAPASGKKDFHSCFIGGLVYHSMKVFTRLFQMLQAEYGKDNIPYSKETIALVALLHDVDKINKYEVCYRNIKDERGQWIKEAEYKYRDDSSHLVMGSHAENSVFILEQFFTLTSEERAAILNHMGGANYEEKEVIRSVYNAHRTYPLAFFLHMADYYATIIDEKIGEPVASSIIESINAVKNASMEPIEEQKEEEAIDTTPTASEPQNAPICATMSSTQPVSTITTINPASLVGTPF